MLCNSRLYFYILQQKHRLKHQIFEHKSQVLSVHIGDVHFLLYAQVNSSLQRKVFFLYLTKQVHSLELDELCDS